MPVSLNLSGKYRDMTPSRCEGKIYNDEGYPESGFANKGRAVLILKVLDDRFCNERKIIQPAEPMNFKER
jgi:hypothetical protein